MRFVFVYTGTYCFSYCPYLRAHQRAIGWLKLGLILHMCTLCLPVKDTNKNTSYLCVVPPMFYLNPEAFTVKNPVLHCCRILYTGWRTASHLLTPGKSYVHYPWASAELFWGGGLRFIKRVLPHLASSFPSPSGHLWHYLQ